MGYRIHRSIKVMPGLRLNLSKSGIGFTTGVKGYHVSHMANGRNRRTISIPGTGLSHVTETRRSTSKGPGPTRARTSAPAAPDPAPSPAPAGPPTPGHFAAKGEKDLYAALHAQDVVAMERIAIAEPDFALAATTLAGLAQLRDDHDDDALVRLQWVYNTGKDPGTDPFLLRYAQIAITVEVVAGASVQLEPDRTTIGLLLAELYQRRNDVDRAIEIVEPLPRTTATALSLADLCCEAGRFDEVIQLTEGAENTDDATALLLTLRGVAFRSQEHFDAARDCFAKVLRTTSRNPLVLHRARLERARCYEAEGKNAQARKDLERIMSEDSDYDGLKEALAALPT